MTMHRIALITIRGTFSQTEKKNDNPKARNPTAITNHTRKKTVPEAAPQTRIP